MDRRSWCRRLFESISHSSQDHIYFIHSSLTNRQEEKKQWYWTVENARPGIFDIDWRSWDDGKVQRMALSLECQQVMILDSKGIQDSFE